MNEAEAQRRRAAISAFAEALSELLDVSDVRQPDPLGFNYGYEPYVHPKSGYEAEWARRRSAVDVAAPKAALAFRATGVIVAWKPPGYAPGTNFPVNPATEWATVLDSTPKFGLDVLQQVIDQALGTLDALVEETHHASSERRLKAKTGAQRPAKPDGRARFATNPWVVTTVGTAIASLFVAYLAFHLGWVGGDSTRTHPQRTNVSTTTTKLTTTTPRGGIGSVVASFTAPRNGEHLRQTSGAHATGTVSGLDPTLSLWLFDYDGTYTIDQQAVVTGSRWSATSAPLGNAPTFPHNATMKIVVATTSCSGTLTHDDAIGNSTLNSLPPGCATRGTVTVDVVGK